MCIIMLQLNRENSNKVKLYYMLALKQQLKKKKTSYQSIHGINFCGQYVTSLSHK